ncbi:MAG: 3-dehydroquinate synthase, partial [Candidatus Dormibacteraeota bacterium]|nr:3-dehydroquinate synthase [Candidatus Dormibacteraeota bacterium]
LHVVDPGEGSKSLAEFGRVIEFLEEARIDRAGVVVALGGGRVGDLAGFAASAWLRGVRLLQVPTSLLAMVDSSVGGKTGVNTSRTKNSVGAFWQPAAVVADLATLGTLPEDEYLAAFAEVVKYGVAMDAGLAERLLAEAPLLRARDPVSLEAVVSRCVELKAGVVAADERESGPRQILNYGHTVGHALEAASEYASAHGRAVALGMRAAARVAGRMGLCGDELEETQEALLDAFGLPGPLPAVSAERVLAAIPRDKKSRGGVVRWVLPRRLGKAQLGVAAPEEVVGEVVHSLLGGAPVPSSRGG